MMLVAVSDAAALAILGTLLLLFAFSRQRRQRRKLSEPATIPRHSATSASTDPLLDAPPSVARFEVAMHETARDLMGRLDTKIVIVEQLIRDANQAAQRIEALLTRIEKAGGQYLDQPPSEIAPPGDGANRSDP